MRIIFSHENFETFGGIGTYVLTSALALTRTGHEVIVYSPNRGAMAELARSHGIPVVGRAGLPSGCDAVISNDAATLADLTAEGLGSVRIFVVHGAGYMLVAPPPIPESADAVVVLNDRVGGWVQAHPWHAKLVRLRQPIDLGRFAMIGQSRAEPRVALVNSKHLRGTRLTMLRAACRSAGMEVLEIDLDHPTPTPETLIGQADVVVGVGRSALEGLAAGRPTLIYGVAGFDGLVTADRYQAMEADGFAGLADRDMMPEPASIVRELKQITPELAETSRSLVNAHHAAGDHAQQLVELIRGLAPRERTPLAAFDAIAHLIRLEHSARGESFSARLNVAQLNEALDAARAQAREQSDRANLAEAKASQLAADNAHLSDQVADLVLHLDIADAIVDSRRVRVGLQIGRWIDRTRSIRGGNAEAP